jgi:hypothetical protein
VTPEDYEQLRAVSRFVDGRSRVAVLSPLRRGAASRLREGELRLFPRATAVSRGEWDLDDPGTRDFDFIVAANVFMYSSRPQRWLEHVLARCSSLLVLDLVRRRRSETSEFGPDGDCMRYAIGDERPRCAGFFDFGTIGDRVLGWRTFYGGANDYDESPMHFIALLQGARSVAQPATRHAVVDVTTFLQGRTGSPIDSGGLDLSKHDGIVACSRIPLSEAGNSAGGGGERPETAKDAWQRCDAGIVRHGVNLLEMQCAGASSKSSGGDVVPQVRRKRCAAGCAGSRVAEDVTVRPHVKPVRRHLRGQSLQRPDVRDTDYEQPADSQGTRHVRESSDRVG